MGWSKNKSPNCFAQFGDSAYCEMAPHIHCLNPASKTGKKTDGERWQKREGNGSRKVLFYIESVSKYEENSENKDPEEQVLSF